MTKGIFIWQRILDVFRMFPKRVMRLVKHFIFGRYIRKLSNQVHKPIHLFLIWSLEFILLILELFGFGETFEILITIFKRSSKPLSKEQLEEAIQFFGDDPIFRKVRIDEAARIGTKTMATAYVTCFTINTGSAIAKDILIHELVHVIQYRKYGLRYMTRAIYGQNWGKGYNYGGMKGFMQMQEDKGDTYFFNPEQEAEFIADLYLLTQKKEAGYFGKDLAISKGQVSPAKILGLI